MAVWKGLQPWEVPSEQMVCSEEERDAAVSYPLGTYALSRHGELWQLQQVPIATLQPKHPIVPRRFRESMRVSRAPIAVEVLHGVYLIADGHHRVEAARRRGEETIRAWVTLVDEAFRRTVKPTGPER